MVFTWDVRLFTATLAERSQHTPQEGTPDRSLDVRKNNSCTMFTHVMKVLYGLNKESYHPCSKRVKGFCDFFLNPVLPFC
jgi:hypothetical protein